MLKKPNIKKRNNCFNINTINLNNVTQDHDGEGLPDFYQVYV